MGVGCGILRVNARCNAYRILEVTSEVEGPDLIGDLEVTLTGSNWNLSRNPKWGFENSKGGLGHRFRSASISLSF